MFQETKSIFTIISYENCWPSIQRGAQGVILVYNSENSKHENDLEGWVNAFPKKMGKPQLIIGIPAAMCMGFAHHLSGKPIKSKSKPRNKFILFYIILFIFCFIISFTLLYY